MRCSSSLSYPLHCSNEAHLREQQREEKVNRLEQRRNRLSVLLEAEKNTFQEELASIRQSSRLSMPEMKIRAQSLRSARENERQAIAKEKLFEHWISNDPELRAVEQEKAERNQPEVWSTQINERRMANEEEERDEQRAEEERRRIEEEEDRLDREEQDQKQKRRREELKTILNEQMEQIKHNERQVRSRLTHLLSLTPPSSRNNCSTKRNNVFSSNKTNSIDTNNDDNSSNNVLSNKIMGNVTLSLSFLPFLDTLTSQSATVATTQGQTSSTSERGARRIGTFIRA